MDAMRTTFSWILLYVSLHIVTCHAQMFSCTFESEGLCGFRQDGTDDFNWDRTRGTTSSSMTGPGGDHTFGGDKGYYMYIEASSPRRSGDSARLISPTFVPTQNSLCFTFYYHMFGNHVGQLNVYVDKMIAGNLNRTRVWSMKGQQGNAWKRADITLSGESAVAFEAIRGAGHRGDIAIDDVTIKSGACDSKRGPTQFSCDFESGICSMIHDDAADVYWRQHSGKTETPRTGPSVDHTLNTANGHYIYLESSSRGQSGVKQGDAARILTPYLQPVKTDRCLTFSYHMYGSHIGKLRAFYNITNSGLVVDVWSLSGNKGNTWHEVSIPLPGDGMQVGFESIRGVSFRGDIALDDVSIQIGHCNQSYDLSAASTPSPSVPSTSKGVLFTCGFETNCGITHDINTDFEWTRHAGPTPTGDTGPTRDHTYGNETGHFMYMEASQRSPNTVARFALPFINIPNGNFCLQFFYHMYGQRMGPLTVLGKDGDMLWQLSDNQGNSWKRAVIPLIQGNYSIKFQATRSYSYKGDISVDDISISKRNCNRLLTVKLTTTETTSTVTEVTTKVHTTTEPETTQNFQTTTVQYTDTTTKKAATQKPFLRTEKVKVNINKKEPMIAAQIERGKIDYIPIIIGACVSTIVLAMVVLVLIIVILKQRRWRATHGSFSSWFRRVSTNSTTTLTSNESPIETEAIYDDIRFDNPNYGGYSCSRV